MTCKELIEELAQYPADAQVFRRGDEYNGDERAISGTEHRSQAGFGIRHNSVLIK